MEITLDNILLKTLLISNAQYICWSDSPYTIEIRYTDNGTGHKGNPKTHVFAKLCQENKIEQKFTRLKLPRTKGKIG